MCLLPCCYSCHIKMFLDKMVTSCRQLQDPRQSAAMAAAAGPEGRQLTLAEMLYPPPSWETEPAATPSWRSSPKVCPVNLADFFSDDEEEADSGNGGGGYSPPGGVNESMSMSVVSHASLRSVLSVPRRVSFRSPDESDVFIIPARSHSDDDDDEWSRDGDESSTSRT